MRESARFAEVAKILSVRRGESTAPPSLPTQRYISFFGQRDAGSARGVRAHAEGRLARRRRYQFAFRSLYSYLGRVQSDSDFGQFQRLAHCVSL